LRWPARERAMLRRKKRVAPSQWAVEHIVVPDDSAEPGKYRTRTVPYAAGILDASFAPGVQEIVICAPSQTGKTTIVNTCLAYALDRAPGNAVVVYPDEVTARDNAKDRLQKMIDASPRLRTYKTGTADDEGAIKIKLSSMIIYMAWANSASRLANRPAPYGVADEEDKYPVTAGKRESGPVDLLRNRARTFRHMRKLWRVSTPTIDSGPIWVALTHEAEAVFDFWVKCPACAAHQEMKFTDIRWEGGSGADPEQIESSGAAWYVCPLCGARWDEMERKLAVRAGEWRDRARGLPLAVVLSSDKPRVIGFHLRAWISPFVTLAETAAAFLRGLRDVNKLKKFANDFAAEPWIIRHHERAADSIFTLCDDRPAGVVPGGSRVACLTAGIDTQDTSFWYEVRAWAWGPHLESWQVRCGEVLTFEALVEVLWGSRYEDVDGNAYFVRLAVQDAMGHRTADVYDFCRKNAGRLFPSQGKDVLAQPFAWSNLEFYPGGRKPIPGGLKLLRFDSNYYKNDVSNRLGVAPGDPGAWHYNAELTETWAGHMAAEFIGESGKWECPSGRANHGWDCSVLNRLAADVLGVRHAQQPGAEGAAAAAAKGKRRVISSGVSL
jgi:terminase, large subunit